MSKGTERISFLPGSYQAMHDGICYKIDPSSDVVEMTQKLNFKYSLYDKEKAINLINNFGLEGIQKRVKLFRRFFDIFTILVIILLIYSVFSSWRSSNVIVGIILASIVGVSLLTWIGGYNSAIKYYTDSFCKKCGKCFALEEVKTPFMKEESRTDTYTKTITRYWHCKNCGYNDTKVEPQYVNHRYKKRLHKLKGDNCKQCGKSNAIEEYRIADVARGSDSVDTRRYYRCRYCGYHEIKIEVEIYTDYQ